MAQSGLDTTSDFEDASDVTVTLEESTDENRSVDEALAGRESDEGNMAQHSLNLKPPEPLSFTDAKNYDKVVEAFENFSVPKKNESVCRHVFFQRNQKPDESFEDFLTDLKKLSQDCSFGALKDSLIKDRIISGIRNTQLKDRLLREENLTFDRCTQLYRAAELANQRIETLQTTEKIDVVQTKQKEKQQPSSRGCNGPRGNRGRGQQRQQQQCQEQSSSEGQPPRRQQNYTQQQNNGQPNQQQQNQSSCKRCGYRHQANRCPAFNKQCKACNGYNHFAQVCRSRQKIDAVTEDSDTIFLGNVAGNDRVTSDWYEKIVFAETGKAISFKLDTGAGANVIGLNEYRKVGPKKQFEATDRKLSHFDGSKLTVVGKVELACEVKANISLNKAQGTKGLIQENKDLFEGIGKLRYVYDFKMKSGYVGNIEPCRKVPFKVLEAYRSELESMERDKIIRRIDEPTEFENPVVLVKKPDNSLRVCLDPQYLNSCLLREHYKLPTFEEIASKMTNAKIFTVLDASKAFWQVELSKASSKLTTFQTPFGRYCFLRMPYGIITAPEIFHRLYKQIFSDVPNVEVYIDDIIIWAQNKEEHNKILQQVFTKARENGVKFNLGECKIGKSDVKFLGHVFTNQGIRIDADRIQAVTEMKKPTDTKGVERLLGMITYVAKFIPNLSDVTAPLRELIKKGVEFHWVEEHEVAFKKIKERLTSNPVLQYYDTNADCKLSVDASGTGVGAVLLQNNLPIAYASKAFTTCQKASAQIEKEMYAIVYGCERFRQYIIGKPIFVDSDHKPLVPISKKPIADIPVRLQKMRLRLQPYDAEITYKPGKDLLIADSLSRAHLTKTNDDDDINTHILNIVLSESMSDKKKLEFVAETESDNELQTVIKLIRTTWPKEIKDVPKIAKPYHTYHPELFESDGLVFKNNCVVVPSRMREEVLSKLHYNHMGIEKTKSRARDIVFWPGMNKQIQDTIMDCAVCQKFQKSHQNETLISNDVPSNVWEKIAVDLFYLQGQPYLIMVDYYSKYVEIGLLTNESSETTIVMIKSLFVRHGIPKIVRSDNGPQFSSHKFKEFAKAWGFEHTTSSPTYPRSNGLVERFVQTVKKMVKKAKEDRKDPYLALLELRNKPISNCIESPNRLMFNRNNKDKTCKPGLVIHKSDKLRAYEVMKESGTILTRNRKYLNRDQNGNFRVKHPPDYFDELPHNEETNRENENTFGETREVEQQLPTEIAANPEASKKHAPPPRVETSWAATDRVSSCCPTCTRDETTAIGAGIQKISSLLVTMNTRLGTFEATAAKVSTLVTVVEELRGKFDSMLADNVALKSGLGTVNATVTEASHATSPISQSDLEEVPVAEPEVCVDS
ncbi:uncharacterized protein [Neodiprion pinetum]|uniref:uncharacterized protein n=1 Tax=Neodiprion pinetum TaxID=441929 RepID=UPI00371E2C96